MQENKLGLDIGTNSIGWAVVLTENEETKQISGMGSRIIPMDQATINDFNKGVSISQTAKRTAYRGTRRLLERFLLRRERLHRILQVLHFLPEHYAAGIDFEERLGQFKENLEPKLAYQPKENGKFEFIFMDSFLEMLADFRINQPQLVENNRKIPHDWTLYYLRKKALTQKISKAELAWILLHSNQKRGYNPVRGEETEDSSNKQVEYHLLKVMEVKEENEKMTRGERLYKIIFENGWEYSKSSKVSLTDWEGTTKEFIVTTELLDDGSVRHDKEGNPKRSFREPKEGDWTLVKKRTEQTIDDSGKRVSTYIYDTLLLNPDQKIKGKLVNTIDRHFFEDELREILETQKKFHQELNDRQLYTSCVKELYRSNTAHVEQIASKDFTHLFLEDVIFYQRPLKSKKSAIANCSYEYREYKDKESGEMRREYLKCTPKSHPLFQEFRIWQFLKNVKVYEKETEIDIIPQILHTEEEYAALFTWLNNRKDINESAFLKYEPFGLKKSAGNYCWNYMNDKSYPCNETAAVIASQMKKIPGTGKMFPAYFMDPPILESLWHILYSVEENKELKKALESFALKHKDYLNTQSVEVELFAEYLQKTPPFAKEYGAYSLKAIKKLLPLMRMGNYWLAEAIDSDTQKRVEKIQTGEFDSLLSDKVREKISSFDDLSKLKGLPLWEAHYLAYGRHSEARDIQKWESPDDITAFLYQFKQHSLRNPIVEQVIMETLRTVRDIWKAYGPISKIHLELGREMKNPKEKREKITQQMLENEKKNLRIKALLAELKNQGVEGVRPWSPSQQDILKIYEEGVLGSEKEIPDEIFKISRAEKPSSSELTRYSCWLEQKYRSPYTGKSIPLSQLFTSAYEIEHIIPQALFFDDSFSNKVICEAAVNRDKNKDLAYNYIRNNGGKEIEMGFGKSVSLLALPEYEQFIKDHYSTAALREKKKKLLMEEISSDFINRQLNDTRYISKEIKTLLSHMVREEGEVEAISKNVIVCTGAVTNRLKKDWGLHDVWNKVITPRFERLNEKTGNSGEYGEWKTKEGKNYFQTQVPDEIQKGFNKKRIDHRHHALDAVVIACAGREHVQYLSNESANNTEERERQKRALCIKKTDENGHYYWEVKKPWSTFTQEVEQHIHHIIISFKVNTRVLTKTNNVYNCFEKGKKVKKQQTKGELRSIRKPLHKETIRGHVNLRLKKTVSLFSTLDQPEMIVDKAVKKYIFKLQSEGFDKEMIKKHIKEEKYMLNEKKIDKVEVYSFTNDEEKTRITASRTSLHMGFTKKNIDSITDTGIQKILNRHVDNYRHLEDEKGKEVIPESLAFSPEGLALLNKNIGSLNNGKFHKPIYKVRVSESLGEKFTIGNKGNKRKKFGEAEKGTNLFFAIYQNKEGERSYSTIPLFEVVERLKQKLSPIPETNASGDPLLFSLSPNELVYVPTPDELASGVEKTALSFKEGQIYKMVSSSGYQCFFVPQTLAKPIIDNTELGSNNKSERDWNGIMIKGVCFKIKTDRLGKIVSVKG